MSKFSTVKINVPDLNKTFRSKSVNYSSSDTKESNIGLVKKINAQYGTYNKAWGQAFELDPGILVGFQATESSGIMHKPNAYDATGVMQVTPGALVEAVTKWDRYQSTPIPPAAMALIKQRAPFLLSMGESDKLSSSQEKLLLSELSTNANFNIMAGVLVLRWLLQIFKRSGYGQLNKAMVAYNAGLYREPLRSSGEFITAPIDSLTLASDRRVPAESRAYIVKMLGVNGFLDLIFKQKVL